MSQQVRTALTFAIVCLNTAIVTIPDVPTWAAGVVVALVTGFAAIGIIPPTMATERTGGKVVAEKRKRSSWGLRG